jgi:hypothetical protein
MNRKDLGNKASAWAAVEVHYNVEGITDIALDGPIRKLNSALEDTTRKTGKSLLSRRCMDGRETARVTGIEKLQEIKSLAAAYLTKDDPVRAVAEGSLQQVADAHCRKAVLWLARLKTDEIVLTHLNFGRVLD